MKVFFTAILLAIFSAPSFAATTSAEDEVKKFINNVGNQVISIAAEKNIPESRVLTKIVSLVERSIDLEWIARFVLAKNYKTATPQEIERFTKLYRDFMINTYGVKFKNYNGRKFDVQSVTQQGGFYLAKAEFLPLNSNTPISIDFRVKERAGKLVIVDFIAEGVSLIETQRSEFNSAISQDGMDEFLDSLEQRVKKLHHPA